MSRFCWLFARIGVGVVKFANSSRTVARNLASRPCMADASRCKCWPSTAGCFRNLSHSEKFFLRARVAGEWRVVVQVNQINRTANRIAAPCAHAIKNRWGQIGKGHLEFGCGIMRSFGRGAKDENFLFPGDLSSATAPWITIFVSALPPGLK